MRDIVELIIDARSEWIKSHTEKPSKLLLNIQGMHDFWEFLESIECFKTSEMAVSMRLKPTFLGMEISFDPHAITPRVE